MLGTTSVARRCARLSSSAGLLAFGTMIARAHQSSFGANKPVATVSVSLRWCSTNPVNVAEFTLNEAIVAKDLEANQRWVAMSKRLDELRAANDQAGLKAAIAEAVALFDEVGADRSPHQCTVLLSLERAQIDLNSGEYDDALAHAFLAVETLEAATGAARDPVTLMEARELTGFIHVARRDAAAAEAVFRDLLQWIDHGSSKDMPMVRVAAKAARRSVATGLGEALLVKAETSSLDPRAEYNEALPLLVDALSQHVDENDFPAGKRTLLAAQRCFVGLKDKRQASATCDRLTRWCKAHNDEAGIVLAAELKAATGYAEPEEEKAPSS